MEYIIVKDNRTDLQLKESIDNFDNIENIKVPYVPIEIVELFAKDYIFMAKFLEYKRDATLALLNIDNALTVYDDNFNLKFEKDIKTWWEFFELLEKYIKIFTCQGVNFYANKNKKKYNNFQIMDEKYLGPIIEKIFMTIYHDYLKKFPYWNNEQGKQSDYINIELRDKTDINNIRYYWNFQGVIFVQDTKYDTSLDGNSFKVEFSGTPKFQIVAFDLIQLKKFKKNENRLRQFIDIIDDKIIEQNLKNFELDLDM